MRSCAQPLETGVFSDGCCANGHGVKKLLTTDASLLDWGDVFKGRVVNVVWSRHLQHIHIKYLELLAFLLTLKHFLTFLRGIMCC